MLRWSSIRNIARFSQRCSYTTAGTSPRSPKVAEENLDDADGKEAPTQTDESSSTRQSKLIAAAFASLQQINRTSRSHPPRVSHLDEQLNSAKDADSLLSITDQPIIAKHLALKAVNKLSDWVKTGECKLSDFDTDARFIKLCRILGRSPSSDTITGMSTDLKIVLGVTVDDQTAKLIDTIELPQMVKILHSLAKKKRRSVSLLQSLSHNIARSSEEMSMNEAADVLYACAVLNYADEVLLNRTITDVIKCLKDFEKPSTVRLIVNSLGRLRYRHTEFLESISSWFVDKKALCTHKESLSFLYTLANLNYRPSNVDEFIQTSKELLPIDSLNAEERVTAVWSLIVLDQYDEKLLDSTLNPEFLQKLNVGSGIQDITLKLKLLNINGYAKLLGDKYKGHLLDETSPIFETPLLRSKDEQIFYNSVLETLENLIQSTDHVRFGVDSKMGFLIDAEVLLDANREFVKLTDTAAKNVSKVAIMVCGYHDMCRGCSDQLTGITALIHKLIRKSGYKLLCIPYTEYNSTEKLVVRIQYLSQKLKNLD